MESKAEVASEADRDTCFVIMPFGGWFDQYYATIYKPAIEGAGLTSHRADDLYRPSMIITDIWSYTQKCRMVLADLTGRNQNVFYELGLAHALAKPAILVTEEIEDVPFDLRNLRVIEYHKNNPNWGDILRERIQKAIGEVLASPAKAVLPAFLAVDPNAAPPSVSQIEKILIETRQELDHLQREVFHLKRGESARGALWSTEEILGVDRRLPPEEEERLADMLAAYAKLHRLTKSQPK